MITLVPGGSMASLFNAVSRAHEIAGRSGKPAYVYQAPDFEWDWGYFIPAGDYFLEVSPDGKIGIGDEDHVSPVPALTTVKKVKGGREDV